MLPIHALHLFKMLCWLLQGCEFKLNVDIEFWLEGKGPFEWTWCHSSQFSTCLKHSGWKNLNATQHANSLILMEFISYRKKKRKVGLSFSWYQNFGQKFRKVSRIYTRIQKNSKNVFFEKKTKLGVQKVAVPKRRATSKGLAARAEILTVVRIIP